MNLEKSELEPKQDFGFVGYQFDLRSDQFRLTLESGPVADPSRDYAKTAIPTGLPGPGVHVLDRLLTATEKLVHRGRLHVRPIQWHLKNNWRVPESLER